VRTVITAAVGACVGGLIFLATPSPGREAWQAPVFDVPRMDGITVDGRSRDWADKGFRVEVLSAGRTAPSSASDFASQARIAWCEDGLLVLVSVRDDVPLEAGDDGALWARDCVELFLATGRGPDDDQFQVIIAPGLDPEHLEPRVTTHDQRKSEKLRETELVAQGAARSTPGGYTVEALLPWSNLGLRPALGVEVAFQLSVRDYDSERRNAVYMWYPLGGTSGDTSRTHTLRLATPPSPPVRVAAAGWYERFRRTEIRAVGTSDLVGKRVSLHERGVALTSATLRETAGRAEAILTSRGQTRAFAVLPNADSQRRDAFRRAEMLAQPFVFSGRALPPCDFDEPSFVEDLVGPYSVRATYYDGDFRPVTSAKEPGRYGAVVEVSTRDAGRHRRYLTLFRTEDRLPRRGATWRFDAELPTQVGIPADVLREQTGAVTAGLTRVLTNSFWQDESAAVLLAGLHAAKPGPLGARIWSADQKWWYDLRKLTDDLQPLKYLTFVPEGYDADATERWPVLLFLHGAGERGDNLERVKVHGPPKLVVAGRDFPFIIVSPQCPIGEWWSPWLVRDALDDACSRYLVDRDRIYVTGLSMGGYGTWEMMAEFPGRFAAAAPICGGGDPTTAPIIAHMPIWAFHGAKDSVVPLSESEGIVEALRDLGVSVRLKVYPEANHDSWTETYDNPDLYRWLLEQRRR